MIEVKFTTFGANSAFGSFAPGDKLRCSPDMAAHLVNEIRCAEYAAAPAAPVSAPAETNKQKRKGK